MAAMGTIEVKIVIPDDTGKAVDQWLDTLLKVSRNLLQAAEAMPRDGGPSNLK